MHLLCLLSVLLFFGKSSFDPTALLARARPLVSSKPTAQPPRGPWTHWPTCLTPIAPFHLRMERGNRRAYCLLFGTFGTTVATFGIWDVGPFYVPGSFGPSPFGPIVALARDVHSPGTLVTNRGQKIKQLTTTVVWWHKLEKMNMNKI